MDKIKENKILIMLIMILLMFILNTVNCNATCYITKEEVNQIIEQDAMLFDYQRNIISQEPYNYNYLYSNGDYIRAYYGDNWPFNNREFKLVYYHPNNDDYVLITGFDEHQLIGNYYYENGNLILECNVENNDYINMANVYPGKINMSLYYQGMYSSCNNSILVNKDNIPNIINNSISNLYELQTGLSGSTRVQEWLVPNSNTNVHLDDIIYCDFYIKDINTGIIYNNFENTGEKINNLYNLLPKEFYSRFANQVQMNILLTGSVSGYDDMINDINENLPKVLDWNNYIISKISDGNDGLYDLYIVTTVKDEALTENNELLINGDIISDDYINSYMYTLSDLVFNTDKEIVNMSTSEKIPRIKDSISSDNIIFSTVDLVDELGNVILVGEPSNVYGDGLYTSEEDRTIISDILDVIYDLIIPSEDFMNSKINDINTVINDKLQFDTSAMSELKNINSIEEDYSYNINIMGNNLEIDINFIKQIKDLTRMLFKGIVAISMFIFLYNNVMLMIKGVKPISMEKGEIKC